MVRVGMLCFCAVLFVVLAQSGAAADGASVYRMCSGCHGVDGSTVAMGTSARLKGQSAEELLEKLEGYADGTYGGSKKMIMTNTVRRLSSDQMRDVADCIAGFGG